ncbi:hypothetical protein ACLOJK_027217, partial [Asimina triloba]
VDSFLVDSGHRKPPLHSLGNNSETVQAESPGFPLEHEVEFGIDTQPGVEPV